MAKNKWEPTKHLGIYEYMTKKGKRYGIRVRYKQGNDYPEINKSGFETIAAAKVYKNNIENLKANNKEYVFANEKLTLNTWFDTYMEMFKKKNKSKDTIANKYSIYNNHLEIPFGNYYLTDISLDIYEDFLREKIKNGYANNSVKAMHKLMKSILNSAVRYEKLEKNRLQFAEIEQLEENEVIELKVLETDEFNVFISACRAFFTKYDFTMIYLAVWGMRRGEVMGVKLKNLTFDDAKQQVRITLDSTRTLRTPEGKGTKTPAGRRILLIDGEGYRLLKYSVEKAVSIAKDHGSVLHQDDFIFRNPTSNRPWAVTRMNDLLRKLEKEYDIKVYPHLLRHNFNTQALLAGANSNDLRKFIGHKNSDMTDHYAHATDEGREKLMNTMKDRLSGI
ncbi:TPA: tyrosine-type recombinase/integrase [Listeria innocua]|nr:tyrosine-type recombinase/integrase [Listeria monocytogenes]HDM9107879.1 site-specific integrase [Listeria monocytogenes]HEL7316052.1 site-specific integrase [Listeria monocytogenes]